MIKGSIQEEDITIVNIYAPNIGAPQYIRHTLTDIKGEIDSNTIIVGNFNTPLTPMDRLPKEKIKKETQVLNDTNYTRWMLDLIDIFRTFHPNAQEHTFFSSAHGTFSRIDHTWVTNQTLVNLRKLITMYGEGNGTPLQYSCLENPMEGGAWQAAVHGVAKSRHD